MIDRIRREIQDCAFRVVQEVETEIYEDIKISGAVFILPWPIKHMTLILLRTSFSPTPRGIPACTRVSRMSCVTSWPHGLARGPSSSRRTDSPMREFVRPKRRYILVEPPTDKERHSGIRVPHLTFPREMWILSTSGESTEVSTHGQP